MQICKIGLQAKLLRSDSRLGSLIILSAWFTPESKRVGSDTNCNAPDLTTGSTDQHGSFQRALSSLARFLGETSQEVTHPWITPGRARLTLEFLRTGSRKGRCTLLVWIVPIKSVKLTPDLPSPFRCGMRPMILNQGYFTIASGITQHTTL